MNNTDSSNLENPVSKVISNVLENLIQKLQLGQQKSQKIKEAIKHLCDIAYIYKQNEQQIYKETITHVEELPLFQFEMTELLNELIDKYFKRISLFKQAYQITQLKSKDKKYSRLTVQEPVIELTIPEPYHCPPLHQAKYISDAKIIAFEDEQDSVERFS